jgi:hypothetical protein
MPKNTQVNPKIVSKVQILYYTYSSKPKNCKFQTSPDWFYPKLTKSRHPKSTHTQQTLKITYLQNLGEVCALNVVVRLDENFTQAALSDWIILGIELVEAVERVAIGVDVEHLNLSIS